jgi:hypothetical protein
MKKLLAVAPRRSYHGGGGRDEADSQHWDGLRAISVKQVFRKFSVRRPLQEGYQK